MISTLIDHIASPAGSHVPMLEASLDSLSPGSLVIEHGAGLYSTPLLASRDVEIQCIESHPGWAEWARWVYGLAGRGCTIDGSWKHCPADRAALVFIDGESRTRGPLLKFCLERGAPLIVAHDTQEERWSEYRHLASYFTWAGYSVTHDAGPVRTTTWARK